MLSKLIVLLLGTIVLFSSTVHAQQSDEVLAGALTQHFTNFGGVSSRFSNKISADGTLIANPMLGWRIVDTQGLVYTSSMIFGGENSIGEMMGGVAISGGVKVDYVRIGLVGGGYLQDDQKFRDRDITPFSVPVGNRLGIAPVAGVEISIDMPIDSRTYVTVYTVITPILSTTTIGFGWSL